MIFHIFLFILALVSLYFLLRNRHVGIGSLILTMIFTYLSVESIAIFNTPFFAIADAVMALLCGYILCKEYL